MKKLTICIAAAAILALPASASAAEKFYGGSIANGGKIGVDVTTQAGEPFQVDAFRYKNFPANCDSGPSIIGATWTFSNFLVVNNRFEVDDNDPNGGQIFFKGTFKNNGAKLDGQLKEGPTDFDDTAGTNMCTSAKRSYNARRNGKGPHPQKMNAKVHRAFRVAG